MGWHMPQRCSPKSRHNVRLGRTGTQATNEPPQIMKALNCRASYIQDEMKNKSPVIF